MSPHQQQFADHFSRQAPTYAAFRPVYPDAVFAWLASIATAHERAVDFGAGSGQASIGLAKHFDEVVAVEPSAAQVEHAVAHPRVRYVVAPAEDSGLADASADLIVCAQSIHWFDLERFHREAHRILRPGGAIAAITYYHSEITPEIDALLYEYYSVTLAGYWSSKLAYVDARYQSLPFPYEEIPHPPFAIESSLELDQLIGFLASWSATRAYIEARGSDPLVDLRERLLPLWGDRPRLVRWPLSMRVGRRR
jgi:SAM-dependent methyltransferase